MSLSKIEKMKAIHNASSWFPSIRRCCDVVKDRKNESHSQQYGNVKNLCQGCCDVVKDRKNESHSQPDSFDGEEVDDVVTLSKIEKMKAIHNLMLFFLKLYCDVVTLSKIEKMKAIHNTRICLMFHVIDVVTLSKIEKMKAIHN